MSQPGEGGNGGVPPQVDPPVEGNNPPPAASSDPPADPPQPPPEGGDGNPPPPVSAEPKSDWRDKRIATLAAQKADLAARLASYEANPNPPNPPPNPDPNAPTLTQADVDRLALERAQQISAANAFNAQCNEVAKAGKAAYPDFDARLSELQRVVDPNDMASRQMYNMFLSAAIETGRGADIIYELGGDLNEATRIMSLSPVKLGMELAKLSSRDPNNITSAPKPITTLGGRNASHSGIRPDDPDRADTLSTKEWMARREKQIQATQPRR